MQRSSLVLFVCAALRDTGTWPWLSRHRLAITGAHDLLAQAGGLCSGNEISGVPQSSNEALKLGTVEACWEANVQCRCRDSHRGRLAGVGDVSVTHPRPGKG